MGVKILGAEVYPQDPQFWHVGRAPPCPLPDMKFDRPGKVNRRVAVGSQSFNFPIKRPKNVGRPPNFMSSEEPLVGQKSMLGQKWLSVAYFRQ